MLDKLDHYDILGIVIPGILLAYWVPICFPQAVEIAAGAGFPEAIDILGFAAIAIFLGQLIQAVASSVERHLYWNWGGMPSERALGRGLGHRYLSESAGRRVRTCLATLADSDASDQDLFQIAMARANGTSGSRTERFNALYAYHRALFVVVSIALLLLIASRRWGAAELWPDGRFWVTLAVLTVILVFLWHRARQRAFYFVREALLVAERSIKAASADASAASQKGQTR